MRTKGIANMLPIIMATRALCPTPWGMGTLDVVGTLDMMVWGKW